MTNHYPLGPTWPALFLQAEKSFRLCHRMAETALGTVLAVAVWSTVDAHRYQVDYGVAVAGSLRQLALTGIAMALAVYDPYEPTLAPTGPPDVSPLDGFRSIDQVLPLRTPAAVADGFTVTLDAAQNPVIRKSPLEFAYQPWSEPRLQELRRRFDLPRVVKGAKNDFEELVALRNWTRSQFRRRDYQPLTSNFDALEVLTRAVRNDGDAPFSIAKHYDPCVMFPLLYIQVLLSMGHQARLMSVDHGIAEVWSNHLRKWVVMDAELNHHFEKDGVPLSFTDLQEEAERAEHTPVILVTGRQSSGDVSTTMVQLRVPRLKAANVLHWFDRPADVVALRNDWMTNKYFPGHPRRSERNSLLLLDPRHPTVGYAVRARPTTWNKERFNWTLNQAHIVARSPQTRRLELGFETVTPNFDHFELVLNGRVKIIRGSLLSWELSDGVNTLSVVPVNQAGVRGIRSWARLYLRPR
jgi:hypothetical protein